MQVGIITWLWRFLFGREPQFDQGRYACGHDPCGGYVDPLCHSLNCSEHCQRFCGYVRIEGNTIRRCMLHAIGNDPWAEMLLHLGKLNLRVTKRIVEDPLFRAAVEAAGRAGMAELKNFPPAAGVWRMTPFYGTISVGT